ncbi:MAG: AraC family transcriptional regulator [Rubrivivax sp.]|nr:AraC family transcriptional regulator [Rubrivivax sp.]
MLTVHTPADDLRSDIECGVVVRLGHAGSVSRFPAMPRAMLTWAWGADGVAGLHFHALPTQPMQQHHPQAFQALGWVLPPVTAARLLGPSTGAMANASLPWAELAGDAEAHRVLAELQDAATPQRQLQALQDSLRRVLSRGPERVRSARTTDLQRLCLEVGRDGVQAAQALGTSPRQLERRCRALLGLAPKQFQRMTRVHGVLSTAVRCHRIPDADAALAAGYYDQSHLAREVRELAGAPLRELLAGARADGDWWPLATQRLGALRHHR